MNVAMLSYEQRKLAVQRLTALWAFTESGLGGVLHALKLPFTGLIVGGIAVMLITFIAWFSNRQLNVILKSVLVVLIVKAVVSPHTPFPAYIAVSFQAIVGYLLFSLLRINLLSILLLSILAMVESAIQKLLVLTFFFGNSIWKAGDELVAYVAKQFSFVASNGSWWLVAFYVLIYVAGGFIVGIMTRKMIGKFEAAGITQAMVPPEVYSNISLVKNKKKRKNKLVMLLVILMIISTILYFLSDTTTNAKISILRAFTWTISAVLLWYIVITPLFTRALLFFLHKKKSKYSSEVGEALSFIPVLDKLANVAWKVSADRRGLKRLSFFLYTLISWSIIYSESKSSAAFHSTFQQ